MAEDAGDKMKGECPECRRETNCVILGAFDQPWSVEVDEYLQFGQQDHRLLQCLGCDKVFYQLSAWDSEREEHDYNRDGQLVSYYPSLVTVFPEPEREKRRPSWTSKLYAIDEPLARIIAETYEAVELRSYILASVGLRTVLDRAMEILGINPGHTLEQKLLSLKEGGFVGETEHAILTIVADAGNAAAHRAWAPDREKFEHLLVALEQFVHRNVVIGQKALGVKHAIPARQARPRRVKTTEKPALTREAGYEVQVTELFPEADGSAHKD